MEFSVRSTARPSRTPQCELQGECCKTLTVSRVSSKRLLESKTGMAGLILVPASSS